MRIIFFDTETTGSGPQDRLCQLAVKERGVAEPVAHTTYKPPVPISIESMTVHHITEKMVAGRPAFQKASEYSALKELFESRDTVAVAHNASFDLGMLSREGVTPANVICTYKVARALDADEKIGKYGLQYLRYFLGLEIEAVAHEAWGDVLVLEQLFERLLVKAIERNVSEGAAIEEMIEISQKPVLFTTLRFGKYTGKRLDEVAKLDPSYLEWLLGDKKKKPIGEEDWIYSLEYYLKNVAV